MTFEEMMNLDLSEYEIDVDEEDFGCDYCRNDGQLENGRCPKCDAYYPEEDQ